MKRKIAVFLASLLMVFMLSTTKAFAYENYYDDYNGYYDYSDYDYDYDEYNDYSDYDYDYDEYDDYSDYNYDYDEYDDYSDYDYDYDEYNDYSGYGDYIRVDIFNQTIELYRNNSLVAIGATVTGQLGICDTPKGVYSIISKNENLFIKENAYVKYWMPFYEDYGIHDADYWRSEYGGDIYTTDGSHGCVNTQGATAEVIYNNSYVGMTVIVE